jgi:hypothetical protein
MCTLYVHMYIEKGLEGYTPFSDYLWERRWKGQEVDMVTHIFHTFLHSLNFGKID